MFGIPVYKKDAKGVKKSDIIDFLETIKEGNYDQIVPALSSYRVANSNEEKHPLWWWSQNGRLNKVSLPVIKKTINSYKIRGFNQLFLTELSNTAIHRIGLMDPKHDFNQDVITSYWRHLKCQEGDASILLFEMFAPVSNGVYIRQLVRDIGKFLGVETLKLEIERICYC